MTDQEFLNFDLELSKTERGPYRARVLIAPDKSVSHEFLLPISKKEVDYFYREIGLLRAVTREFTSPQQTVARDLGKKLFEKVFKGDVRTSFFSSLKDAKDNHNVLRIRLIIKDLTLANLPWEYLYASDAGGFLATDTATPIIRYDENSHNPAVNLQPPLKVLAVVSKPRSHDNLDVEKEWKTLSDALSDPIRQGLISLERLDRATRTSLKDKLSTDQVHILHFMGHGTFDDKLKAGYLVFEKSNGDPDLITGEELGTHLRIHPPLQLVVLNACEGARSEIHDPLSGVASCLIKMKIPAVIAMQAKISDQMALAFTRTFYKRLAQGVPIDIALSYARTDMFDATSTPEWGTPVLFTSSPSGVLFNIIERKGPPPGPPRPPHWVITWSGIWAGLAKQFSSLHLTRRMAVFFGLALLFVAGLAVLGYFTFPALEAGSAARRATQTYHAAQTRLASATGASQTSVAASLHAAATRSAATQLAALVAPATAAQATAAAATRLASFPCIWTEKVIGFTYTYDDKSFVYFKNYGALVTYHKDWEGTIFDRKEQFWQCCSDGSYSSAETCPGASIVVPNDQIMILNGDRWTRVTH